MTSLEERNRLIASHQDASDSFDRALMTLSAGSLGLSIAFVKDIDPDPVAVAVLEASWILMGFALFFIVFSFAASVEVHKRLIDGLDTDRSYEDEPWWVRRGVSFLNGLSAISFVGGAILLIVFAIKNV